MAGKIIPIAMPKWGMEMVEGQITKWNKKVGDAVAPGEQLIDIETDKMTNVYEAEFTGVLRRRIGEEGKIYPVGQLIAVVADANVPDAEIDTFVKNYKAGSATGAPAPEAKSAPAPSAPQGYARAPNPQVAAVPQAARPAAARAPAAKANGLSAKAVEEQIAGLGKEVSPIAARVAIAEGVDLKGVGATGRLGRISLDDVEKKAGRPLGRKTRRADVSPRARRLAREKGLDVAGLIGSGPNGRVMAIDIASAAEARPRIAPALAGDMRVQVGVAGYRTEPTSAMRRTIARRLVQSKATAPHIYLRAEVSMVELIKLREGVNKRLKDARVSLNDFLVRAAGLALAEVPEANVQYTDEELFYFDQADISVAIALPQGLVAPIVRGADKKPVTQIAEEIRALAQRARAGGLTAADLEGGTFTVSNLGMFGIESFDAVINPPQAAILAVGAVVEKAVGVAGVVKLEPRLALTLSCDHRAIDGALGARYLAALKELIENPVALVL